MKIVKKGTEGESYSLQTKQLQPQQVALLKNEIVQKILLSIQKTSKYPKQIAKEISVHEQNVYYYIKKLERNTIITLDKTEDINGTQAQFYKLSSASFFIQFEEFERGGTLKEKVSPYFEEFISSGKLNTIIVVGSPEPHTEFNAVAKDGHYGMYFCLFLGSYLSSLQNLQVKLDTQLTDEDLKNNNIISIGGVIVNAVSKTLNEYSPIHYTHRTKQFESSLSKKIYNESNIGVVCKFENPFNSRKKVILISGIGKKGTETAVLSFLHHFDTIEKGNLTNSSYKCNVFLGRDYYSKNEISKIDVLE